MHWKSVTFDWNQVRAFLVTVEEGSLSAAARELGLTQPTLGRQVAALEKSLNVTLFERVGKSLLLTPSGLELLEHVREMGEAATKISLTASGQSEAIEGEVRITASDVLSAYILPEALRELRKIAPMIDIDVVAANDIRDLQRREADIAIRHVRPAQPDLIARLTQNARAHFYAASEYLNRVGRPDKLADLNRMDFISYGDTDTMLAHLNPLGLLLEPRNFRLGSRSGVVAWEMVKAGLGIAVMSSAVGSQTPEVERVLPDSVAPIEFPIWLTTHRELHTSRRIRVVFDFLDDFLSRKRL